MKFIKKNKGVILFYIVIVIGTLAIACSNERYEQQKSASAGIEITDTQNK